MSTGIGGVKNENTGFEQIKKIGVFQAEVVAVNPTIEQYKDILGIELKENSKAADYLGESKDGNTVLRVDFWLKERNNGELFKVNFFLENEERSNKDNTKSQYINEVGSCSWASDESELPKWFTGREYRVAYKGEEDFYNFLRAWLSSLDYRNPATTLQLDWKKLMKGNVKELKDQLGGDWATDVIAMATVVSKEKTNDDTGEVEIKDYQVIYNRAFLPLYTLKAYKQIDYNNSRTLELLSTKLPKELKAHERFVMAIAGEYGCKNAYSFSELHEFIPGEHITSSNEVMTGEDDY